MPPPDAPAPLPAVDGRALRDATRELIAGLHRTIDAERLARQHAENDVHALRERVALLEARLRERDNGREH